MFSRVWLALAWPLLAFGQAAGAQTAQAQAAAGFDAGDYASQLEDVAGSGFFGSVEKLQAELLASNRCPRRPQLPGRSQTCAILVYSAKATEDGKPGEVFYRQVFGFKRNSAGPAKSQALVLWDGRLKPVSLAQLFAAAEFENKKGLRFVPYAIIGNREDTERLSQKQSPFTAAGHVQLFDYSGRLGYEDQKLISDWQT